MLEICVKILVQTGCLAITVLLPAIVIKGSQLAAVLLMGAVTARMVGWEPFAQMLVHLACMANTAT
jgi:hypothetical protein